MYVVSMALYEQYKELVLRQSLSFQEYDGSLATRPMTDRELAGALGLDEEAVREIRCIAEIDLPVGTWYEADRWKAERGRAGRRRTK